MKTTKVSILGTEYQLIEGNVEEFPILDKADGFTDHTVKKCVVNDMEYLNGDVDSLENLEEHKKKTIRHELIHAFAEESGLSAESWARNEEMVDWFAIQSPKIFTVFRTLGII